MKVVKLSMHGIPADFYVHNNYTLGKTNKSISSKWIKGNAKLYYSILNAKGKNRESLMLKAWQDHK